MVLLRAIGVRRELAPAELRRGTQRGGVGLDEDAFTWDGRGELDAQVGLARDEVVRAEGEISAEPRELRHELDRAVPAVQEETALRVALEYKINKSKSYAKPEELALWQLQLDDIKQNLQTLQKLQHLALVGSWQPGGVPLEPSVEVVSVALQGQ